MRILLLLLVLSLALAGCRQEAPPPAGPPVTVVNTGDTGAPVFRDRADCEEFVRLAARDRAARSAAENARYDTLVLPDGERVDYTGAASGVIVERGAAGARVYLTSGIMKGKQGWMPTTYLSEH